MRPQRLVQGYSFIMLQSGKILSNLEAAIYNRLLAMNSFPGNYGVPMFVRVKMVPGSWLSSTIPKVVVEETVTPQWWSQWHGEKCIKAYKRYYKKKVICKNGFTTIRTWHPNGELESETIYKDGKESGLCRSWHYNGRTTRECVYTQRTVAPR